MPPKVDINLKLTALQAYVTLNRAELACRTKTTLQSVFAPQLCPDEKSFYNLLWSRERIFTFKQKAIVEQTLALLTPCRETGGDTHLVTDPACNDPPGKRICIKSPSAALQTELPALDAALLNAVCQLGRKPREYDKVTNQREKDETALAVKYRKSRMFLLPSTTDKINAMTDAHLPSVSIIRSRQTQLLAMAPSELIHQGCFLATLKSYPQFKEEQKRNKLKHNWFFIAGVRMRTQTPPWCIEGLPNITSKYCDTSCSAMHYDLSCVWLSDVDRWSSGSEHSADKPDSSKRSRNDFFAACRSPVKRLLEPFPLDVNTQFQFNAFAPHQCLRQLALIELEDIDYIHLPLEHNTFLEAINVARMAENLQCNLLSEMHEAAIQCLIQYISKPERNFANARFLNLMVVEGQSKPQPCRNVFSAHIAIREMVTILTHAFEKENIDMTVFKPKQFATLSVYYSKFLS
jgi:hypothetical protein